MMHTIGQLMIVGAVFISKVYANKKPSYRWGTARRGRASWNLV